MDFAMLGLTGDHEELDIAYEISTHHVSFAVNELALWLQERKCSDANSSSGFSTETVR